MPLDPLVVPSPPPQRPADVIVANATRLAHSGEEFGYGCSVLPSVIEIDGTAVESGRRVALVVNPIASKGSSVFGGSADGCPTPRSSSKSPGPSVA